MTVLFSYGAFRFPRRLGTILEGDPVVLVERGKTIDRNLRRNRITVEELAAQARLNAQITHRGRRVGRPGDERPDQLHSEERFLDSHVCRSI